MGSGTSVPYPTLKQETINCCIGEENERQSYFLPDMPVSQGMPTQKGEGAMGGDWDGWDDMGSFLPPIDEGVIDNVEMIEKSETAQFSWDSGFPRADDYADDLDAEGNYVLSDRQSDWVHNLNEEWPNIVSDRQNDWFQYDANITEDVKFYSDDENFSDIEDLNESLEKINRVLSQPLCQNYKTTWIGETLHHPRKVVSMPSGDGINDVPADICHQSVQVGRKDSSPPTSTWSLNEMMINEISRFDKDFGIYDQTDDWNEQRISHGGGCCGLGVPYQSDGDVRDLNDKMCEEDDISDGEAEAVYYESLIVEGELNQMELYGSKSEDEYVSEEGDSELFSVSEDEMEISDTECDALAGGSGDVKQVAGHGRKSGHSQSLRQAVDRVGIG